MNGGLLELVLLLMVEEGEVVNEYGWNGELLALEGHGQELEEVEEDQNGGQQ